MRIGIIVAMDKEFAQLQTLATDKLVETHDGRTFVKGRIGDNEVVMRQCGIGKVNSAIGAVEMINRYSPDLVISTGVAGGADTSLNVTDVVVSTECCYHDVYCGDECKMGQVMGQPARFGCPAELVNKATSLSCGTHVRSGLIVSGDWFVNTREKMQSILDNFPDAEAVDMESCSIAQTCNLYNTPFISFRIISDIPLKDHKAQMYFDFWERMAEGSFEVTKAFLESI